MGVVYRARHLALDRERALKVITPELSADERFRARFEREARLAAHVEHPNVIPVHHAGDEGGRLYLSMRLVEGVDLADLVRREGPLAPARIGSMISAIAAGLDAAHGRGLIHRDVKPSNILVEEGPGAERVFITDFGISMSIEGESQVTASGEFLGSPDYAAPEHISDESIDARADIYSLGAVAYFLLTGEPPFANRSAPAKLVAHASGERPRPSRVRADLGSQLDDVIARAMAIAPGDRYASAGDFARELRRALAGTPEHDEGRTRRMRRAAGHRRGPSRRTAALLTALLAAALAAAAIVVATSGDEGPTAIPVGGAPNAIAIGESTVWVTSHDDGTIWGIDPDDAGAEPQVLNAGLSTPRAIAVGFQSLWVVDGRADQLLRIDPGQEGLSSTPIPVGRRPADVAVGDTWVWVANEGEGTISQIDPARNAVVRTVPVGGVPRAIATGPGGVWVADPERATVQRIYGETAAVPDDPINVGRFPSELVVRDPYVWVAGLLGNQVRRVDIAARELDGPPIPVGTGPRGLALRFGSVWTANGADDTVTRIDARTGAVVDAAIAVGDDPAELATGFGSIWTANFGDDTVTRLEP